ncbi:hypothetical protein QR680_017653 [Steinernema hermaphroditum]|uniref:Mediator of RNA polymerase II transcription subunit 17 n=1 Tax=Steinernema hermaphroditum TaxID=289476 RepID=A0AA39HFC6_9BILA|nr:hypothetical protein QR680_017653 [Steinernema hermaphroditum]
MFNGAGLPGNGLGQNQQGVQVAIEPMTEWQIDSIGYDGIEKYIIPPGFADFVAKGAMKVDWRKMVDSNGTFDDLSVVGVEEEQVQKPKLEMEDRKVPEAGPWHEVAKHLHETLQQINVLSDTMKVLKAQNYIDAVTVQEEHKDEAVSNTTIQNSRQFHWIARRKALTEANNVIEKAQKARDVGEKGDKDKEQFFRELRELREHWRIKKVGGMILGDIGYRIFGQKYAQRDVFNIWRKKTSAEGSLFAKSALQVRVPADLMCRTRVTVSIVRDSRSCDLYEMPHEELEYMDLEKQKAMKVYWKQALKWAQDSLINRDIYQMLFGDSTLLQDRICAVKKDTILVSLFDDLVLKIQKVNYKFEDGKLPAMGITYLNRTLRQMFLSGLCRRNLRVPSFAYLPLTTHNLSLDMRAPHGLDRREMEMRVREESSLLSRLITVSSHYILMERVSQTLLEYTRKMKDPNLSWRLSWASPSHSLLALSFSLKNYEQFGKKSFFIKVEGDGVQILTKEQHFLDARRDSNLIMQTIHVMYSTFMVHSFVSLCRTWNWEVLHANLNGVDHLKRPAPTFYSCNKAATVALFVQFRSGCLPPVFMLRTSPNGLHDDSVPFVTLKYDLIPGTSTMKKAETIFGSMRD